MCGQMALNEFGMGWTADKMGSDELKMGLKWVIMGSFKGAKGHSNVVVSIDFIEVWWVFKMGSFRSFDVLKDEHFFHEADGGEIMGG